MRFLIVQDHKENRKKCTLTPLEGAPGFSFMRLEAPKAEPATLEVGSGILLRIDAPPLSRADRALVVEGQLVLVDSTWIRAPRILDRVCEAPGARLEARSLPPGICTAYPRVSKLHRDPPGGLASVEAIFAATVVLGEPAAQLLEGYRWASQFLERNLDAFRRLCPGADFFP